MYFLAKLFLKEKAKHCQSCGCFIVKVIVSLKYVDNNGNLFNFIHITIATEHLLEPFTWPLNLKNTFDKDLTLFESKIILLSSLFFISFAVKQV